MRVREILSTVEQQVQDRLTRKIPVDHFVLLDWLGHEINAISGMGEFDFLLRRLDPMILTSLGRREYTLPEDFPENFARGGDDLDSDFMCKLNTGSAESFLTYKEPAQFFSRTIEDEAVGKPADYTILTRDDGARILYLGPPPDSNSDANYTINGLYQPTSWTLNDEDQVPPIPGNAAILRYALLRRIQPENGMWAQEYERQRGALLLRAARSRISQMVPHLGRARDDHELMSE